MEWTDCKVHHCRICGSEDVQKTSGGEHECLVCANNWEIKCDA